MFFVSVLFCNLGKYNVQKNGGFSFLRKPPIFAVMSKHSKWCDKVNFTATECLAYFTNKHSLQKKYKNRQKSALFSSSYLVINLN